MHKTKLIHVFYIFILLASCYPHDDGLNSKLLNLTTEGKNTFGCKINGQTFLPRDSGGLNIEDPVPILKALYVYDKYNFNGYRLFIFADNEILKKTIFFEMTGSQTPLEEGGIYPLISNENENIQATYEFWEANDNGVGYKTIYTYNTNNEVSGELKIVKLDTENQIISGTFWFDCKEVNTGKIAEIREGRFDINYTILF